jgi:hypothetical protein
MNETVRVVITGPIPELSWEGLADGFDTRKADAFLDRIFDQAAKFGRITITINGDSVLRLDSPGYTSMQADMSRVKTKVRMLCARLAVRCREWSNRPIAPYGDTVEIVFPPTKQRFKVRFENTTAVQEIAIELQSENGAKTA